jgi:hypothetical protein
MADIKIEKITRSPELTGPLKVLDTSDNSLSILKYPSNLGNPADSNEKNHWVTFRIYDIEPAKLASADTGLKDNKTVLGLSGVAAASATVLLGGAAVKVLENGVKKGTISKLAAIGAGSVAVGVTALAGFVAATGFTVTPPTSTTKSIISLYMPDSLVARYDAQYDEMSLTKDLGPAITTLRAIDSAGQCDHHGCMIG